MFKKSNQIWKRFEKLFKIKFDWEPVYDDNDKYIKTKTKIYGGSVNTYFHGKKIPKEKAPCKSLSIIMLDFVVKLEKKYYPQTLLEEYKYEPKKIKTENLIDDDLEKGLSNESIMILTMKYNLMTRKIMMNLINNLLKAKRSIFITVKA